MPKILSDLEVLLRVVNSVCLLTSTKEVSQYRRTLSLDSALASVQFNIQGTSYRRDFFVSYPDQVMVVRLTASQKADKTLVYHILQTLLLPATLLRRLKKMPYATLLS